MVKLYTLVAAFTPCKPRPAAKAKTQVSFIEGKVRGNERSDREWEECML
jgi:hypothetical protein